MSQFLTRLSKAPLYSRQWWMDSSVIMGVFAVTGSSTMLVVRPAVQYLHHTIMVDAFADNTNAKYTLFNNSPWSFKIMYLMTTMPVYSLILYSLGRVSGKSYYFNHVLERMWGRILPQRVQQRLFKQNVD
ncbi:hypothetical protein MIR68_009867 [Amoeboaphelidium protococcarum]|nr:hypothetical protein MIR68_009867 [Amoeboaphelidium protococcarum]